MPVMDSNPEVEVRRQYNRRVFFCIRVREAALLIGLWDLFIHVVGICILIYLFQHDKDLSRAVKQPDTMVWRRTPFFTSSGFQTGKAPNELLRNGNFISSSILLDRYLQKRNLSRIPPELSARYYHSNANLATMRWAGSLRNQDRCIIFFIIASSIVLIVAHIFGILLSKPAYLIPYFLIKLFNLVISILSLLGFYAYMPNIKIWLLLQPDFPFKQNLLELDGQALRLIAFGSLMLIILAKLYMVAIIWHCYGYITTLNMARHIGIHRQVVTSIGYFSDQMYSPPKYEEAIQSYKGENDDDAPPPYAPLLQGSI